MAITFQDFCNIEYLFYLLLLENVCFRQSDKYNAYMQLISASMFAVLLFQFFALFVKLDEHINKNEILQHKLKGANWITSNFR